MVNQCDTGPDQRTFCYPGSSRGATPRSLQETGGTAVPHMRDAMEMNRNSPRPTRPIESRTQGMIRLRYLQVQATLLWEPALGPPPHICTAASCMLNAASPPSGSAAAKQPALCRSSGQKQHMILDMYICTSVSPKSVDPFDVAPLLVSSVGGYRLQDPA